MSCNKILNVDVLARGVMFGHLCGWGLLVSCGVRVILWWEDTLWGGW